MLRQLKRNLLLLVGISIVTFGFMTSARADGYMTGVSTTNPYYHSFYAAPDHGLYVGATLGGGNVHGFIRTLTTGAQFDITNNAFTPFIAGHSVSNTSGRAFGGFQFNPYFAIEAGYTYFGPAHWDDILGTRITNYEEAADAVAKFILPLPHAFSVYAKAGPAYLRSQLKGNVGMALFMPAPVTQNTVHVTTGTFGFGGSYTIYQTSIDLYWNRFVGRQQLKSADFVGVGLTYHFV